MAGVRMTGLASGLDTESMVKELVKASSTKVNKVKQKKQLLQWKKEAWQSLNTKLYDFYKTEVSSLRLASTFKAKKATSSDDSKVSINPGASAANGAHTVSVKQLASSAYLTGAKLTAGNSNYTTYANAGASTNFADMTDASGNSLNLTGSTITIKSDNGAASELTFELGGAGENGVANIDELNKKLASTAGFEKLKASFTDGKLTFTNSTAKKDEDGIEVGTTYTVESSALGISGEVGFKSDEKTGVKNSLTGEIGLNYKKDFTSADITGNTKLSDIGIKVGTTFSIKGKDFVVDDSTTLFDLSDGLSKMGVSANYDKNQGRFYINASNTGEEYDFEITSSDSSALDKLGLSVAAGAKKVDAQDAIIDYNGVEYTGSSNNFNINGMTITAKAVTGKYDKVTGAFTDDAPINISVSADVDGVYNSIKNFVKKYNELIDEMNTAYSEKKPEYEPLTDEERSQLSDTQIEQWEKKAKVGLLRRDETISNLLTNMRSILNKGVKVTDKDGNESTMSLASLGIVTGDFSEKGKLHILGDADDPAYAAETNKLKAALENNPEIFSQLFVGDSENQGIGAQLYSSLGKAMARSESSHSLTFYNDISMDKEVSDKDDEISKWEEKLKKLEDKYYDQFAAMEKAMAQLQSQQSYIASLFGTA